jgi:hypothetical protein
MKQFGVTSADQGGGKRRTGIFASVKPLKKRVKCVSMKLVAECRRYAEEYRKLAATTSQPEEKQALETMARAWENVANKWEAQLLKQIDRHTGLASLQ